MSAFAVNMNVMAKVETAILLNFDTLMTTARAARHCSPLRPLCERRPEQRLAESSSY
jgi:hypothetical protein